MGNKDIIRQLRLAASLMELHSENPFKIRSYQNAILAVERLQHPLEGKAIAEIASLEGIGKSLAASIKEMLDTGSFAQLNGLLDRTPKGVIPMLEIKGLGPKKVFLIWQELGIVTIEKLLEACNNNVLSKAKGFGEKTQESIKQALLFMDFNKGKHLYAQIEAIATALENSIQQKFPESATALSGQFRRRLEIIDKLCVVVAHSEPLEVHSFLNGNPFLERNFEHSGPFVWRGKLRDFDLLTEIYICKPEAFTNLHFKLTGALPHLQAQLSSGKSLLQVIAEKEYSSEKDIYEAAGLSFVEPELREGIFEIILAEKHELPILLEYGQLKGTLHNHSSWSDGKNTLREMAAYCKELGFEYLGISDHSRTAVYANGLDIERVAQQQREIADLNKELSPFRIFKGIESDILPDGSLDYPDDILATFDFVVASIHGNLNLTVEKATQRLLKAIRNPYTTILGHPTGRLLLRREGYPLDHKEIIEACAENGVIIEINANPRRLDLDWRWVQYALEKGVMLSINPDAHHKNGYHDMYYGVLTGRKGGLTAEKTFNTRSLVEVEDYLKKRKKQFKDQA